MGNGRIRTSETTVLVAVQEMIRAQSTPTASPVAIGARDTPTKGGTEASDATTWWSRVSYRSTTRTTVAMKTMSGNKQVTTVSKHMRLVLSSSEG